MPRPLLFSLLLSAATVFAWAQGPAGSPARSGEQPLTEKELLQQMDAIGKSDPLTAAPRSAEDTKMPEKGTKEKKANNGVTEITSREAGFEQRTHTAVFLTQVYVENPEFTLSCDKLTAFMRSDDKGEKPKEGAAGGKPAGTPAPGGSGRPRVSAASSGNASAAERAAGTGSTGGQSDAGGGLEKAIAEGNVVITQQKVEADGTVSKNVGRSKRAVYESATGNIILTGSPEVQQGTNTCVAQEESTVIVLNRAGKMDVRGRAKFLLRDNTAANDAH